MTRLLMEGSGNFLGRFGEIRGDSDVGFGCGGVACDEE